MKAIRDYLERLLEKKELELDELSVIEGQNAALMKNVHDIREQLRTSMVFFLF